MERHFRAVIGFFAGLLVASTMSVTGFAQTRLASIEGRVTDESSAVDASYWYLDADADGYGNGAISSVACDAPGGYVADASDCNDLATAAPR